MRPIYVGGHMEDSGSDIGWHMVDDELRRLNGSLTQVGGPDGHRYTPVGGMVVAA